MNIMRKLPREELKLLAAYVEGFAEVSHSEKLKQAAEWLKRASRHICAQGYFGCLNGDDCTSDHK